MNTFTFRTPSTLIAFTILFCTLLSSSTKAQTARLRIPPNNPPLTLNPTDTDEVIRLFTTLKSSELPKWLHSNLSEPIPSQSNRDSFARATWLAQLHIVQDEPTCDRLKEQAAPILKLFRTIQHCPIFPLLRLLSKFANNCRILFRSFDGPPPLTKTGLI